MNVNQRGVRRRSKWFQRKSYVNLIFGTETTLAHEKRSVEHTSGDVEDHGQYRPQFRSDRSRIERSNAEYECDMPRSEERQSWSVTFLPLSVSIRD